MKTPLNAHVTPLSSVIIHALYRLYTSDYPPLPETQHSVSIFGSVITPSVTGLCDSVLRAHLEILLLVEKHAEADNGSVDQ